MKKSLSILEHQINFEREMNKEEIKREMKDKGMDEEEPII
jgi:hypothetical protein